MQVPEVTLEAIAANLWACVGVSTVAVPSGASRSCGWPEVLLANSFGWKKRARSNSDCEQRQGS